MRWTKTKKRGRSGAGLAASTAGAVFAEYVVVLVVVSLVGVAALVAVGIPMVRTYHFIQALAGLPVP